MSYILQKILAKNLKFGNPIRYLKALALERERVKSFMLSKKQFLKPGNYKMLSLGKTIVYRDSDANDFLKKQAKEFPDYLAQLKLYSKQILANLFFLKLFDSGKTTGDYEGDFVLFTQAGDAKVFDLSSRVVLNFLSSPEAYDRLKTIYTIFEPFFSIPVKGFCDKQLMVIEKYVDSNASSFWSKEDKQKIFVHYCDDFTKYLRNCVKNEQFSRIPSSELLNLFPTDFLENQLFIILNKLLSQSEITEWPHLRCHGDFWLGNILLEDDQYYLIGNTVVNMYFFMM